MWKFLFIAFTLSCVNHQSYADVKILPSCRASFNIKPNRIVSYDNQSFSCLSLETIRTNMVNSFDYQKYDYIVNNINQADKEITQLIQLIESNNDNQEELKKFAQSIYSRVASIYALEKCLQAGGKSLTCIVAGLEFISALQGIISSAESFSDKAKKLEMLKSQLNEKKRSLERHKNQLPDSYARTVNEFNSMCEIIKKECI